MERADIFESIARTLYVNSYADLADSGDTDGWLVDADQCAGPGEDWFDTVTSPTPDSAIKAAASIAADFERLNGCTIERACQLWAELPGHPCGMIANDPESRFGYALAMHSLGHGVGLWDDCDKPADSFRVPHSEYSSFDW